MIKYLIPSIIFQLSFTASAQQKPPMAKISKAEQAKIRAANIKKSAKTTFGYFVISAYSSTYGYSIYADGNLYIQQNTIPAMPGNKGFADTTAAAKTARLVIKKIKQGEMPPTISIDDLKKLNIIK